VVCTVKNECRCGEFLDVVKQLQEIIESVPVLKEPAQMAVEIPVKAICGGAANELSHFLGDGKQAG